MITTPSGLQYEDTVAGTGDTARSGHHVSVHYTGWLHDPSRPDGRGAKFDSSKDRGQPFRFGLGAGQVIGGDRQGPVLGQGQQRRCGIRRSTAYARCQRQVLFKTDGDGRGCVALLARPSAE